MSTHRADSDDGTEDDGCGAVIDTATAVEPELRVWMPGSPEPESIRAVRGYFVIWVKGADGQWRNPRDGLDSPRPWEHINKLFRAIEFRGFATHEEPAPWPRRLWRLCTPDAGVLLRLPVDRPDGQVVTLRTYLTELLAELWHKGSDFSAKRPLGSEDWQHAVYDAMVRAGYVVGRIDGDGEVSDADFATADKMIVAAIEALDVPVSDLASTDRQQP